jgi:hypothetical protein
MYYNNDRFTIRTGLRHLPEDGLHRYDVGDRRVRGAMQECRVITGMKMEAEENLP